MKIIICFCLLYLYFGTAETQDCPTKQIVCYYGSWSYYRPEVGQFAIENIDPSLCTHLIYAFAGLDINSHIYQFDSNLDITLGGYANFIKLKEQNPCLKTSLAIGGWNEGSRKYSVMASTDTNRELFADGLLRFLTFYGFDGIDVDWEYPTERGGLPEDQANLAQLLTVIKNKFRKWNMLVTMAVPIAQDVINNAYDMKIINESVDFVHIMAYDYTASTSKTTGLNSPLSKIQEAVQLWIDGGVDPKKLILGLASYGRSFVLEDESKFTIGAPVTGPGPAGIYTNEDGFLSYYEILELVSNYEKVTEDGNNYSYLDDFWVSYDDEVTVRQKVAWAIEKGLGGAMMWSIDTDDFSAQFSTDPYPLLRAVNDEMKSKK